jgi:uncharacterized protein YerC
MIQNRAELLDYFKSLKDKGDQVEILRFCVNNEDFVVSQIERLSQRVRARKLISQARNIFKLQDKITDMSLTAKAELKRRLQKLRWPK